LSSEIDDVIDQFADKGVELSDRSDVRAAIKAGFEQERSRIGLVVDGVAKKHDLEKVGQIRLAKIYPANVPAVASQAAHAALDAQFLRYADLAAQSQEYRDEQESRRKELDEALTNFSFRGCLQAVSYGPVQDFCLVFDGHSEAAAAAFHSLD
jgi:hypothetical protein